MAFGETSQEIGIIFATVYAKLMRGTPTDSTVDAKSLSNCISMISIKNIVEDEMAKHFSSFERVGSAQCLQ